MLNLLEELKVKNIQLSVKDNNLVIDTTEDIEESLIKRIRIHKEEIISYILKYNSNSITKHTSTKEDHPVSDAQKRLWLQSLTEEGSKAYHINHPIEFPLTYNPEVIRLAVLQLIKNFEIFRTVFNLNDQGEIRQIVLEENNIGFDVEIIDLKGESDDIKVIEKTVQNLNSLAFDLSKGPLLRAKIYELKDKTVVYFIFHHIIIDGVSLNLVKQNILNYYQALSHSEDINSPKLQYLDYTYWKIAGIKNGNYIASQRYWVDLLSKKIPAIDLPSYTKRPSIKTFNSYSLKTVISSDLTQKLDAFAKQNMGTLNVILLSAINVLLNKYTSENDITLGTFTSGRNHPSLNEMPGLFVNTIVLNSVLDSEKDTLVDIFRKVKESFTKAFTHQDYPFDLLIENLQLPQDTSRNPLFDITVVFQDFVDNESNIAQSDEIEEIGFTQRAFDINFEFINKGSFLEMVTTFNVDIYDKETIISFINHFKQVLHQFVGTSDTPLKSLDYIDAHEMAILDSFNCTEVTYPSGETIISLFEKQVLRTPDQTAVIYEDTSLSYSELNARSNQLAHYLREKYSIQGDDLISIQLPRSERMLVAILGILKSGGAYVPIAIDYPQERIDFILNDTQAKANIDESFLLEFESLKETYSTENVNSNIKPDHLAYIIYTSGTTGNPKGVMIEHSSLINRLIWMQSRYPITDGDVLIQKTSYTFDVSVWELLWGCIYGAALSFPKQGDEKDPSLISDAIEKDNVSVIHFVPSMFTAFLNHIDTTHEEIQKLMSLKTVFTSGEALSVYHKELFYRLFPENVSLVNLYGPTEACIDVTYYDCIKNIKNAVIPIGKPISNTQMYVLDGSHQIVPIGITGELYISGDGLARGYLKREDLTKERFIDNPFVEGTKMYRTGDLGRWLPDGNIEYLGRTDHQVKIRGHRIELSEIDNQVLLYSESIKAVVTEVKEHEGDKSLIVYYVCDSVIDKQDLSHYLETKLPQYMLPSFYVVLENIPLTSNGKIDRKNLPEVSSKDLIRNEYIAPRNEAERQLKEIWEEILGVENIGVTDNFFELGGHSLILIRIINKIKTTFNKTISIKDFMENPRIDLVVQKILGDANFENFEPIEKVEEAKYYPITAAQYRFWVIQQNHEASATYNVSEAYKLKGALEASKLEDSFKFLVDRYEILRTIFININGTVFQQVLPFDKIDFKIESIDLSSSPNKDQELTELLNTKKINFKLDEFPLFKIYLIKVDNDEYILWFNTHHIICDGWSSNLFASEIIKTYNYLVRNESPNLPDLKIQYKDYANWVNKKNVEESRDFWINALSDDIKRVELPFSGKRKKYQTFNGDKCKFVIHDENVKKVKRFLQGNNISLFTYLVACTKVLLNKYTHQNDVIIGTTFSGRDHSDLENQLGLFLNTIPLRSNIDNNDSFSTFLAKEKKNIIDAFSNGNYPFDQMLNDINYQKDISKSALYDVSVVLNNHNNMVLFDGPKEMDDLVIESHPLAYDISKNDIEFNFSEGDHELLGIATYNTDLYDRESVEKFVAHLKNMIEHLIDSPDEPLSEFDYLSSAEEELLLKDFNNTFVQYPDNQSVVSLFEDQVGLTPEDIAVVYEDLGLSYAELNEKASSLAVQLQSAYGIKKGDQVGVMLNRGENQIISILGILKLGAVYVPVDANLPESRKAVMTSGLSLLITESYYFFDLDFYSGESFSIDLEFTEEDASGFQSVVLEKDDIAYIIYTSGSTGEPKGVLNTHGGILNTMLYQKEFFEVSLYENVAQFASFSFDASISEIFMTLLSGKSLHILNDSTRKDAYAFEEYVNSHSIDLVTLPPAFFSLLNIDKLQNLKGLITAGESAVMGKTKEYLKYGTFYNAYGPTESSICATVYKLEKGSDLEFTTIPIGQPIANTQIYILDEYGHLVPVGVSGEMYISGAGLAEGYLNLEDLTEEKFVDNPFVPGTKMYRTGDLGRWLMDGNIEYLGRIDHQVKIRGHRIELGEIDSQVLSFSDSIKGVVTEVKEHEEDKSLVVYYVSNTPIDKQDLSRYLERKLPQYMLPGFYVELDNIPLTSNGKIHRKNLPEVSTSDLIKNEYVAPANESEEQLKEIWQEILRIENIGVMDNFFELGGNSMNAIRIIGDIQKRMKKSVTINVFLEKPTIKELAEVMKEVENKEENTFRTII
ncbi:amino acid adenylation domain-containing protein [Chryseobacterium gambrini]|uniref:Non-ribosomal peptide synthetase n=1 Tax=Chryseobacterium gambrini TaxID=373672 RepID=A0ABM8K233_9FLAO|nr:non-ribosomal peptide synthetase [Chryseobacterium gambrini]